MQEKSSVEKRFDEETSLWTSIDYSSDIIGWERKRRLDILKEILSKKGGKKMRILEVGCGAGINIAEIAAGHPGWYCYGVDFSENMVKQSRRQFGKIENLKFERLDIQNKALRQKFDFIFLLGVIGYVDNKKSFKNIGFMLKPGGELFFTYGNRKSIYRKIRSAFSAPLDYFKPLRDAYNFVKAKIIGNKALYDPKANKFMSYSPKDMRLLMASYSIISEYSICFSSGLLGRVSVWWSRAQEALIKKDALNLAMTKIIHSRKKQ